METRGYVLCERGWSSSCACIAMSSNSVSIENGALSRAGCRSGDCGANFNKSKSLFCVEMAEERRRTAPRRRCFSRSSSLLSRESFLMPRSTSSAVYRTRETIGALTKANSYGLGARAVARAAFLFLLQCRDERLVVAHLIRMIGLRRTEREK